MAIKAESLNLPTLHLTTITMINNQHPNTPPSELLEQWEDDILNERDNVDHVLVCAWQNGVQAGAAAELEACAQLLDINNCPSEWVDMLRDVRRPTKPPSIKEQALDDLRLILAYVPELIRDDEGGNIRRALEQLKDD